MEELKRISPREPCSADLVFDTLCTMSERTAGFGVFNYLLSNGQSLYAHCSTRLWYLVREWPFSNASLVDADLSMDFAQTNNPEDRLCVVATQPLTRNENWQQMQPGQLLWMEEGRIVRQAQLEVSEAVRKKHEASLACV
jgi:glutamine amidotransferase